LHQVAAIRWNAALRRVIASMPQVHCRHFKFRRDGFERGGCLSIA
jgi:hypothetical protein